MLSAATTNPAASVPGNGFTRCATAGLSFRPVTPADDELVYQIYACTRTAELAPVPWSAEQKEAFLRSQSAAQEVHYAKHYRGATFDVIMAGKTPCGRLYLYRSAGEYRIVDVALLPAFRGLGYGTAIVTDVQAQAHADNSCVTIHVEHTNPARHMYERLGFKEVTDRDRGVYLLMQWGPAIKQQAAGSVIVQ